MRIAGILLGIVVLAASAVGQESSCITSVKEIPFRTQSVPKDIRAHIPKGAFVRLVLRLASTDTLTIYELGERPNGLELNPDTRLLITRNGRPVYRFAVKNLPVGKGGDPEWGLSAVAMKAVHLCSGSADITYLVLQSGNQGGYFAAFKKDGQEYRFVPIRDAQQGRLVLNINDPYRIAVWTVASEDVSASTGCRKHYTVETMNLDGDIFKVLEKRRTKETFNSFQDSPLIVSK